MKKKPLLSFWQLWNMSFGYLGIQFGFALQNANISRIFETLHASTSQISLFWIAGPITGLLVHPIVGHMSDKTWNKLGRRKPYFLVGAVMSSLALLIVPNSPMLWVAAGMLWIMDGSINMTMQPFRAFIGDMLPQEQQTKGFAVQTFFIGISSVVASSLPYMLTNWFKVSNTAPDGIIPSSVKLSFYAGGVIFLLAVLWTIFKTKEYSPEEMQAFGEPIEESTQVVDTTLDIDVKKYNTQGFALIAVGIIIGATGNLIFKRLGASLDDMIGLYILVSVIGGYGIIQIIVGALFKQGKINGMVEIVYNIKNMPAVMKKLSWVQMLTWFGLFAMFIFSTKAITAYHFGSSDTKSKVYNDGANWVGVLMSVYNGVAAIIAFLIPAITKKFGSFLTHAISLIIGGLGLISWFLFKDPQLLIISMVGVGIAWASILTLPYSILTCSLPQNKMGVYMGVFNLFIVIPQIIASAILGVLVNKIFGGQAIYTIVLGGMFMVIAGIIMFVGRSKYEKIK
ncbi:MAG TPA: MFS transporter [Ferruginibacter sp.]|jgi:maltose/moltooligosaccharide transporter|nr:MFS transporter [Ferruginibacter sp.]